MYITRLTGPQRSGKTTALNAIYMNTAKVVKVSGASLSVTNILSQVEAVQPSVLLIDACTNKLLKQLAAHEATLPAELRVYAAMMPGESC